MSRNTPVSLGAHFTSFIDAQVQGGCNRPFDVIRILHQRQDAGLHL